MSMSPALSPRPTVSPRIAASSREELMKKDPIGVFVIGWADVRLKTVLLPVSDVTVTDVIVRDFTLYMFQGDAALYPSPGSVVHGQLYQSTRELNLFPLLYRNGFMSRARKILVEAFSYSTESAAVVERDGVAQCTTPLPNQSAGPLLLAECEEGLFPSYFSVSRAYHIPDGRWSSLSLFPLVTSVPIAEVRHLFAYGTLRPDDKSGAHWTVKFAEGMQWEPGYVRNVDLAFLQYPVVVIPSDPNVKHTGVFGCLMWCEDLMRFREKLKEADSIEGSPHLYQRGVVMVHPTAETERDVVPAFIYYRTPKDLSDMPVVIPSGDFCKR